MRVAIRVLYLLALVCMPASGDEPTLSGEWRTSLGVVTFELDGDGLVATFANSQIARLKGSLTGRTATFRSGEGQSRADARLTLDDSGFSFAGSYRFANGRQSPWNGWRSDPDANKAETGRFDGLWLTTIGLMELGQTGEKVHGNYALRGTSKIEGTITGRRLDFHYRSFRDGNGWFDLSKDGTKLEGAAVSDGASEWYGWRGRRAPEYRRYVPLAAGKIVQGSTNGLLTYSVRAPEGYREGDSRRWPAIVILHGSNMNCDDYVNTIVVAWPDLGRDYLILGINGEFPSAIGEKPLFNFTYVNYVGRSTFRGFPGTDRESPVLVARALTELKQAYPIARYFVGGHSQGGFLTYSLLMNSPELIAGAFPISGGVIFQCEPAAYDDEAVRKAQRSVPLTIVHGRNDPVVDFGMGRYAANLFGESSWPAFHFFVSDTAGHMFAFRAPDLWLLEAIRWP